VSLRIEGHRVVQVEASEQDAQALLRAARVDRSQSLLRYPLAGNAGERRDWSSAYRRTTLLAAIGYAAVLLAVLLLLWFTAGSDATRFFEPSMGAALLLSIVLMAILIERKPPAVVIGSDGLRLEAKFISRFVAYADIEEVRQGDDHVALVLRDGDTLTLPTWRAGSGASKGKEVAGRTFLESVDASWAYRERLYRDIESARAAALAGEGSQHTAIPGREGRTVAQWRSAIAEATRLGYRRAALTAEQLLKLVSDADATVERRVGAALGLRSMASDDPELGAELRRTIQRCADPRCRIALERAAADELDEELLLELEQEARVEKRAQRRVT
jgi:hypothetical protein